MIPDRRRGVPDLDELERDYALQRAWLIREEWKAIQQRAAVEAVLLGGVIVGCLIASLFLLDEPRVSGFLVGAAISLVGGLLAGAISGLALLLGFRRSADSVFFREVVLRQPLLHLFVAPIGSLAVYVLTTMVLLEESFVAAGYRPQAVFFVAFLSGLIAPRLVLTPVFYLGVPSALAHDEDKVR